jgi:catechol 2,3-dioxygenase-like lactoylglutathione lyase family enzyme
MKSTIGHLQINIHTTNIGFYRELFTFLGWRVILDESEMLGVLDPNHASLWFGAPLKDAANDYDGIGTNHIAINVPNQSDVDETVTYLGQHGIKCLFGTPCHRPDFSSGENTYYQVMFESPDHLLFEVVYMGPKQ